MQQKEAKLKKEIKDAQAERDEVRLSFALLVHIDSTRFQACKPHHVREVARLASTCIHTLDVW